MTIAMVCSRFQMATCGFPAKAQPPTLSWDVHCESSQWKKWDCWIVHAKQKIAKNCKICSNCSFLYLRSSQSQRLQHCDSKAKDKSTCLWYEETARKLLKYNSYNNLGFCCTMHMTPKTPSFISSNNRSSTICIRSRVESVPGHSKSQQLSVSSQPQALTWLNDKKV